MAEERFAQDLAAPENPDQSDSGAHYVLGKRFGSPTQPGGSCIGADWRCPNNAPSGSQQVALWALAGGAPLAVSNTFVGSVGIINRVLFVTPFTLVAGAEYVIGVQTNRYVYTNAPPPYPMTSSPGGYLSAPSGNGRLVGTTAGVLAFPSAVSAAGSSYHITPVVLFGVDANASLAITLPKQVLALSSAVVSAASLGITLPKPVLAMNAAAIAGANLGMVLPLPSISISGGSLPENLREYVWRLLSQDSVMNSLGINQANLYSNNAPDSPAKDQQLWGILSWGLEEAPPGRDTTSRRRFLVFWVYCRENDFNKIQPLLHRARTLLYPLKGVNHSPGGWITEVGDSSFGEDLYDPAYEASTKGLNLTITASGI